MRDLNVYSLLQNADTVINHFLGTTYPEIAHAIAPLVFIVVVLYWVVFGLRIYAGYAAIDWAGWLNRVLMSITVFSVLVWDKLASQIYGFCIAFVEGMTATLMTGKSTSVMLERLWGAAASAATVLMGDQLLNSGITLQGFGLFCLNSCLCVVVVAYMAVAKFGLALTMLMLPVFVGFALFPLTRQWIVNWLSMMLNFSLLYIFVIAIVQTGFLMFEESVDALTDEMNRATIADLTNARTTHLYLLEGVLLFFVLQAKGWAMAMSKNICTHSTALIQKTGYARGGV